MLVPRRYLGQQPSSVTMLINTQMTKKHWVFLDAFVTMVTEMIGVWALGQRGDGSLSVDIHYPNSWELRIEQNDNGRVSSLLSLPFRLSLVWAHASPVPGNQNARFPSFYSMEHAPEAPWVPRPLTPLVRGLGKVVWSVLAASPALQCSDDLPASRMRWAGVCNKWPHSVCLLVVPSVWGIPTNKVS